MGVPIFLVPIFLFIFLLGTNQALDLKPTQICGLPLKNRNLIFFGNMKIQRPLQSNPLQS
ncbi:hypothetical protein AO356_04170 [Pseudomonas fluorescens]|uniref:Uncharacterized protein n=1 Tax=Pseudomonas fluorescens TaxID=294 RepID=A0A0N9WTZ7_PSEFL|nr:hypothetical protein AO356_04170 [Pseudomonas fluorescens]